MWKTMPEFEASRMILVKTFTDQSPAEHLKYVQARLHEVFSDLVELECNRTEELFCCAMSRLLLALFSCAVRMNNMEAEESVWNALKVWGKRHIRAVAEKN